MHSAHYVYAIVRRNTPLPMVGKGNGAGALTMVPWRELAAVAARRPADDATFSIEAMLHHEAVVEAVRHQGPALPVRFGTMFRDETSVASALAERYDPLVADLDRVGDKVELSLTALWASASHDQLPALRGEEALTGQSAGARYLLARAAELRREETMKERARLVARRLDQALSAHALDRRVTLAPVERVAVRTAYLLDPAGVTAFRAAFDAMRRERREVRLLLTGPWPPYSFVTRTEVTN